MVCTCKQKNHRAGKYIHFHLTGLFVVAKWAIKLLVKRLDRLPLWWGLTFRFSATHSSRKKYIVQILVLLLLLFWQDLVQRNTDFLLFVGIQAQKCTVNTKYFLNLENSTKTKPQHKPNPCERASYCQGLKSSSS